MDDPRRRRRATAPQDPGAVGASPGHLRRVRGAGALLIVSVAVRFVGFIALFVWMSRAGSGENSRLAAGTLILSSALFVWTGVLALSRPGRQRFAWGPGLLGLLGLLGAEGIGLVASGLFLVENAQAMDFLFGVAMPVHAGLLVVAASGLLGHIMRLLRPGARMRRSMAVLLSVVIILLATWTLSSVQETSGLMAISMIPLPFLAVLVGLLMVTQRIPSRAAASAAIDQGLAEAGAIQESAAEEEGDGVWWTARVGGRTLSVHLDDARLPLAVEITAHLDPVLSDLSLEKQERKGEGVSTGDVMLDHLVTVEGISPIRAAGLLAGQYAPILAVLQGRPGSAVRDGSVVLRASIGPGQDLIPRSAAAQCVALSGLIVESIEDALALAEALETRQEALPAEMRSEETLPAAGKLKRQVLEDHA